MLEVPWIARSLAAVFLLSLGACRLARVPHPTAASDVTRGAVHLTQSIPAETSLATDGFLPTEDAWRIVIDGAKRRLDLAFFYGSDSAPSRLTPIVEAMERAPARGVAVRAVFERAFLGRYPAIPERLREAGAEVRVVDRAATTGGIVHTKMLAADGQFAWVGSANLDWRSLEHIHELGVFVSNARLAEAVHSLVEADLRWPDSRPTPEADPNASGDLMPLAFEPLELGDEVAHVAFAASPRGWLPDSIAWDWPHLEELVQSARTDLTLEFLTYGTTLRDGTAWPALDDALRDAVARGVHVTLTLSSWAAKGKQRGELARLRDAGVDVRIVTIPDAAGGPIPFARVIHGKTVVADGRRCWVGTSNGEGDYFRTSRNAGFFLSSSTACGLLRRTVAALASGPYARPLDD